MKTATFLLAAAFAGMALIPSSTAQERVREQSSEPPKRGDGTSPRPSVASGASGQRFIQVFVSRNDRNGDGFATTPDGRRVSGDTIFKRLDTDVDGKLTVAEFSKSPGIESLAKAGEIVARIDQDKDGTLSREEFDRVFRMRHGPTHSATGSVTNRFLMAMGARGRAGSSAEQLASYERIFARLDSDGDGSLTAREFVEEGSYLTKVARAGIFRASDADGDGVVTSGEYVENRIITDEAKAIVGRADLDRDGRVTEGEFLEHPALTNSAIATELFSQFDTSGDGEIVTSEYLPVWGRWARGVAGGPEGRRPIENEANRPSGRGFGGPPSSRGRGGGPPDPAVLFQQFDRNEDGGLAKDEVPEFLWGRISSRDADQDGVVTKAEFRAGGSSRGPRP